MSDTPTRAPGLPLPALAAIFFFSGFPALLYQLIWQRSLFSIYGINVESVTVIVAAFMCGLGLGSVVGGWVSARPGAPLLLLFGVVELLIGAFGLVSLDVFAWIGTMTLGLSTGATGLVTFALIVVPTLLMGATLPLLVEYLVRRTGNVGRSVGLLYFVNTLGSAVACFAGGLALFMWLGQRGVVLFAAAINVLVGLGALVAWRLDGSAETPVASASANAEAASSEAEKASAEPASADAAAGEPAGEGAGASSAPTLPFTLALVLSGLGGFIALSYEILWFRVFSFAWQSLASTFAFVLGSYLLGIALGSAAARRFCDERGVALRALGWFVIAANALGFLVVPLTAATTAALNVAVALLYVAVAAGALGAILPLVSHAAIAPGPGAGAKLSYLYLANIVGSTAGSLLTGFLLLDRAGIHVASVILAVLGLAIGVFVLLRAGERRSRLLAACALSLAPVLASSLLFHALWAKLLFKDEYDGQPLARTLENKSGVINVTAEGDIYGGGAYDGAFSTNLVDDQNYIVRCYALSAFHPAPKRILEIGLSSGSWAQVLVNHPQVESLTSIEINAGYVELIREREAVASLLDNPKLTIHIDDGRRWLQRNPDETYDAIVMNTTWNWRAHSTNLLSLEFQKILAGRLRPGGVLIYNSTWSPEVFRTAAEAFPHVGRLFNFVVASNDPLEPQVERLRQTLLAYRIDGEPVIDAARHAERLEEILGLFGPYPTPGELTGYAYEPPELLRERVKDAFVITDDNMGTEYRRMWQGE